MNALSPQPTRKELLAAIKALSESVKALSEVASALERIHLPNDWDGATPPSVPPVAPKPMVFRDVVLAVSVAHEIACSEIMDMTRHDRARARARWAVWQALSADHGWSASKIARRFNCDHTTVLNGLRRAKELWGAK